MASISEVAARAMGRRAALWYRPPRSLPACAIIRSTSLPLRCGTTCGLRGLTVRPDPCDRKEAVDRYRKTLPMSRPAMQRLSFFLLMGVTLYASLVGAG